MTAPEVQRADPTILPYARREAHVRPWDPRAVDVAAAIAAMIRRRRPELAVEHIGSTAVPGLPGKGIVDLSVEVDAARIPEITRFLLDLGFQPQPGPDPWPPTRPMLVGAVEHQGDEFRIHFHVQPIGGDMPRDLAFRDALRNDPELKRQYTELKTGITGGGSVDGFRYTHSKTTWILAVYKALGFRVPAILPPATIGILGGGQLGRMLALAARELGYRVAILDPDPSCPAAGVADRIEVGRYDDVEAARRLAEGCAVVTCELEHVSVELVKAVEAARVATRPGPYALKLTQDRLAERRFIEANGVAVAPWREVATPDELRAGIADLGPPLRLKASIGGYDGRSQVRIGGDEDLDDALAMLARETAAGRPMLLERELPFAAELSVIVARGVDGVARGYPIARNVHDRGILVESSVPAGVPPETTAHAVALATDLATGMGMVGLLTAELFLMPDGGLVVNELAPRVHNSGHWTIEGAVTSQFEQHVRAICGLPLGSTELRAGGAATVNLLGTGDDRDAAVTGIEAALEAADVHVHVYDKRRVFERRKMGHVTAVGDGPEAALAAARAAAGRIGWADDRSDRTERASDGTRKERG
ncbi:MAG TPA: 5-(carboxyamino)imidazole ribonucleotide synthase [Candidatus Limnocylindrales bacterium]|nr:5-(carboxyamino)imidazole ribonucleotide synthase [Candidatus Limnocylindrales bacterium]